MSPLTLQAPAKINLTLDILGTRPDGYHEMDMVMQSVSLCDEITLDLGSPGGIRAESGLRFLPNDKGNLAVAAALAGRETPAYGARELRRKVSRAVEQALADRIAAGTARPGVIFTADVDPVTGKIVLTTDDLAACV